MNNTNTNINSEDDKNNTISTNDEFKNQNTNNELKKNLLSVQNAKMSNTVMNKTNQRVRYKKLIRREAFWFDK